ncbi:MAG TPA: ABC transporter permease subunit [Ktedonobacterales bacterium]
MRAMTSDQTGYTGPTHDAPAPASSLTRLRAALGVDRVMLLLVMLYLLIPLAATLPFGLTTGVGFSLAPVTSILTDPDFSQTIVLSLELAFATTILTVALVTPTAYWIHVRLPQARPIMEFLTLTPFAVPAIVMAFGLVEVYSAPNTLTSALSLGLVPLLSSPALNIVNTPPLLVCAYVIVALPFVYRPIDNSLRAINTSVLLEAASSLGSGWWRTFLSIITPNILPGVLAAALLTFSTVMGEFTLASLFSIYTFPIYLDVTGQNDPHKAAALAVLSFLFTLVCGLGLLFLIRLRPGGAAGGTELDLVAGK